MKSGINIACKACSRAGMDLGAGVVTALFTWSVVAAVPDLAAVGPSFSEAAARARRGAADLAAAAPMADPSIRVNSRKT